MHPVYVIGCGAVGIPLVACIAGTGREAVGVRLSEPQASEETTTVDLTIEGRSSQVPIRTIGISRLTSISGTIVVTTKAHTNRALAMQLREICPRSPIVVLQNGLGVERPFTELGFDGVYRCVLYVTAEGNLTAGIKLRAVAPSPVGVVKGTEQQLAGCVAAINSEQFPFRMEADTGRESWTKTIINSVFNSICPLLDADNGLFSRDAEASQLAHEVVTEGVALANRVGIPLEVETLMGRVYQISSTSNQAISTLQDLRAGRETEIEFINLELARIAASLESPLAVPRIESLGRLIALKSKLGRHGV